MTVFELAQVKAHETTGHALEQRIGPAVTEITRASGLVQVEAYRCVEDPDAFILGVEWTSVEAHLAWRETPGFEAYRSHIVDLIAQPPAFAHYRLIARALKG